MPANQRGICLPPRVPEFASSQQLQLLHPRESPLQPPRKAPVQFYCAPCLFVCASRCRYRLFSPSHLGIPFPPPSHPHQNTMASAQPPFGTRSYNAGRLPDRSVNANAMPLSASSFTRQRLGGPGPGDFAPDAAKASQQAPAPPVHSQTHGPSQDSNPLSRLTEEQREEINEAVSALAYLCALLALSLLQVIASS